MKKIITLLVLLAFFKGNTQCPAPSNLVYSTINTQDALLSWSENGTATTWDIAVVPDFYVGAPLPSNGWVTASTNPFVYVGLPPGCNVFFVRSICSATDVSPWTALATSGCDTNVTNYLATLSTNDFSFKNNFKIFPNPSSDILFIENFEKQILKIDFFDLQGRIIKTINENKNEYQIDISNLQATTYIIKLSTETGSETVRFIKN